MLICLVVANVFRPTPRVTWRGPSTSRFTDTTEGHGTEIVIKNIDYEDAGEYFCKGTNSEGEEEYKITLTVQCKLHC